MRMIFTIRFRRICCKQNGHTIGTAPRSLQIESTLSRQKDLIIPIMEHKLLT